MVALLPMIEPVVLVCLAVLPYLRAIRGEFLFDDPSMLDGQVPSTMMFYTARGHFQEFHRIRRSLTLTLDAWLWSGFGNGNGLDASGATITQPSWPWHTLSLTFHAGTTLAVWGLITSLHLFTNDRAFLAAALFAVHPLQVSAVAYISGRSGVQAVFFSVLGFMHAVAGGWHWLLVPVCHYFAWKSKEDGLLYLCFYPVILWKI